MLLNQSNFIASISITNAKCEKFFVNQIFRGSSPAVTQKSLQDVRWARRAENRPLHPTVSEVAAVDFLGTKPLFDPVLDAVVLREAHGLWTRRETVIHERHCVLK